ncbi:hypothetical protein [Frankia sp. AgW1.1]|uniref:hypothetical protein n=1 Tax=Frankia sp. AgW1.1 TaxID=1836971 RepID=UPI0019342C38|nr:hypothetical protein [Frankia sp. AgW1.1]MBL7487039.1 hypothetical protein [Frankia sp. AgW1.1]
MTILTIRPMEPGTGASPLFLPVIPGNGEADRTVVLGSRQITEFMARPAEPEPDADPAPTIESVVRAAGWPNNDAVHIHRAPSATYKAPRGGPAVILAGGLAVIGFGCLALAHSTPSATTTPAPRPVVSSAPLHDTACDPASCLMRVVPVAETQQMSLGEALGMAVVGGN